MSGSRGGLPACRWGDKIEGTTNRVAGPLAGETLREPMGVVGCIVSVLSVRVHACHSEFPCASPMVCWHAFL
jgi:hypothetical protein